MSDKTEVLGTMMTDTPWRKYVSRWCRNISDSNHRTDRCKNLLIRKFGIGVVAESLALEMQSRLIDITDIHI